MAFSPAAAQGGEPELLEIERRGDRSGGWVLFVGVDRGVSLSVRG